MYKLGHRFERWNKRYFVLTKDMLYYYKGDNRVNMVHKITDIDRAILVKERFICHNILELKRNRRKRREKPV